MYNKKISGRIMGNVLGKTHRREFNRRDELDMEVRALEEYAKCIGLECKKWKNNPDAVFRHGYADEKVAKMQRVLERGKRLLNR